MPQAPQIENRKSNIVHRSDVQAIQGRLAPGERILCGNVDIEFAPGPDGDILITVGARGAETSIRLSASPRLRVPASICFMARVEPGGHYPCVQRLLPCAPQNARAAGRQTVQPAEASGEGGPLLSIGQGDYTRHFYPSDFAP